MNRACICKSPNNPENNIIRVSFDTSKTNYLRLQFLFISLYCLSLFVNESSANNLPLSFSHNTTQHFRFTPGHPEPHQRITNSLLQLIAHGNHTIRAFTTYTLNTQIDASVTSSGIRVAVKEISLTGDVFYRDFLVDELLIPDKLNLEIDINDITGNTIETIYLSNFDFVGNNDTLVAFGSIFPLTKIFGAEVVKAEYFYSNDKTEKLNLWKSALTSYYAANSQIDQAFQLISNLDPENPETLIVDEFRLCQAEDIAGSLMFAPFQYINIFKEFDPLNIRHQVDRLNHDLSHLRNRYNFNISHIDSLLFSHAVAELAKGNQKKGEELLNRVLIYHPSHIPTHLILANDELIAGRADQAISRLKPFVGERRPAPAWIEMTQKFASNLFDHQIEYAKSAMDDGRFLYAMNHLKILEDFCLTSVLWKCPEALFTTTQMAYHGMYNSYLRVAQRAYATGIYNLAESYTDMAITYQRENVKYIPDPFEAINLLRQIYNRYITIAKDAYSNLDPITAHDYLNRAIAMCEKYPSLDCKINIEELKRDLSKGVD